ncbi:MAG: hypothetical protein NTX00_01980 [Candidatus Parcubacteria bacterium]|nr:hypothetical protein [Candidatus Parcubacteria bacterium]
MRHVNPPLNIYKKIAISFIILTLVLVVVIFYFTMSYAYVTVYPKQDEVKTDFNFAITENQTGLNPEQGVFMGKIVEQSLDGEKLFVTTGKKSLLGDIVGRVKITNGLSRNQILVATTRLLSPDNVLYRLKERVEIPAQGKTEVNVYADNPSLPLAKAETKFTIPGLSPSVQTLVYAQAIQDFKANGQEVTAISQEELDKAVTDFSQELAQQAIKNEDTSKTNVLSKEIIDKTFDHKAGDEVLNFNLKLKIKVTGVIFDNTDIKNFALKSLTSQVPPDKQLISSDVDSLIYNIDKIDFKNKLAQLKSFISGIMIIGENSPILQPDKLARLNAVDAVSYLQTFDSIERAKISFFPSWVKKMPYFEDHIIIKIVK